MGKKGKQECEEKGDEFATQFDTELKTKKTRKVKLAVIASYNYLFAEKYEKIGDILDSFRTHDDGNSLTSYARHIQNLSSEKTAIETIRNIIIENGDLHKKLKALARKSEEYKKEEERKFYRMAYDTSLELEQPILDKLHLIIEEVSSDPRYQNIDRSTYHKIISQVIDERSKGLYQYRYWFSVAIHYSLLYPKEILEAIEREKP